jgi:hypothetical protein
VLVEMDAGPAHELAARTSRLATGLALVGGLALLLILYAVLVRLVARPADRLLAGLERVGSGEPALDGEGSTALGQVGAVIFSPSDVELVAGGPGARRRFLDIVLSLAEPGYLHAIQRYRQSLFQRNTLLRQGSPRSLIEAWDEGLVLAGSRVAGARAAWVAEHAESFAAHYARVAGGQPGRSDSA